MLGKLIKQEWKAVWKILGGINLFLPCLTLIGAAGLLIFSAVSLTEFTADMLRFTFIMTYILAAYAVTFGVMIYIGVRYYRSMYGSEGYLTHTLPATPLQLITSKLIVSVLWQWITLLVMSVSIIFLVFSVVATLGYPVSIMDILEGIRRLGYEMSRSGVSLVGAVISYAGMYVIGTFFGIVMMYACAALGQLFDRHRILSAVGIYFGFTMVMQIIIFIIVIPIVIIADSGSSATFSVQIGFSMINIIFIVVFGLATAGLFVLTHYLTKKKLNLE